MTNTQDRPLKIAIFSDSALPILNGVSVSIDALISGLRSRGHSVHLFTAAHRGHRDDDPNVIRFYATETPWTKGYPLALPPFYPMIGRFRRQHFDVIHTHTPFTIGFVGLRWGQSHDIPVVSTYHTLYDKYAHYIPFVPKRYLRYKLAKHTNFYYNQVDQVITPSAAAKKWLDRHSVKQPVTIIPTGAVSALTVDRAEARSQLGIGPNQKVLLYVGRIAREKNMSTLIEAVALAFREDPNLIFMLVGDGPSRVECMSLAQELGIGDRVKFVGFRPRNEVDLFYAAADLFVFASMTETQGLVIAEAMTHGLPAIVVQGGGASAAVIEGKNGVVVRNDPAQFAHEVVSLLRDEDRFETMSMHARHSVRSFTRDDMVSAVVSVYRAAMDPSAALTPQAVLR